MSSTNDSQSFEKARNETISYHKLYYSRHQLFDEDSWLAKPDAGLMKLVEENLLPGWDGSGQQPLQILDLGCGVGRNAIPVAMAIIRADVPAKITCVDVLDESINLLMQNCITYGAEDLIEGVVADNDSFAILPGHFDLIAAISVVEHCAGRAKVLKLLKAIATGLKPGGFVRIEMTTDRNVIDLGTKQAVPTHVETPLTERQVKTMLDEAFKDFEVLSLDVFPYKEVLDKDGKKILWQSKQVSFSARATQ
jgi:SAM-dependent methyltransferase